jgi:Ankyrin repeats (3 copies)
MAKLQLQQDLMDGITAGNRHKVKLALIAEADVDYDMGHRPPLPLSQEQKSNTGDCGDTIPTQNSEQSYLKDDYEDRESALFCASNTPLGKACCVGNLEIVKLLVKQGADVTREPHYHMPPIHQAAWIGYIDILEYLVFERGVNVN